MMFPTDYNRHFYGPDFFLPLATSKRYISDEYPSQMQNTPEYNPLNNTFRPITLPYSNEQFQNKQRSRYNKRNEHDYDNEQQRQQNIPSFQASNESLPTHETSFVMNRIGGEIESNDDFDTEIQSRISKHRHLLNNLFDILVIGATCLIFALIYLLIDPVERGFYCDDTSIQYPYKDDTIPMWLLIIYGGVGPVIIFFIVELWVIRPFNCGRVPVRGSLKQRRVDYIKTILQTIPLFGLGVAVCVLITEVGKRTIGRLRPYYITICNPIWANIQCTKTITTASGPLNISQYILHHTCNSTASERDLEEARLSFPSGHSSYSTYAFIFLFVYFEARLICPNIRFLKPFLQCLCIAIAFFTSLSRVTDFKHHATDVIGGAIIGFSIAVFAVVRVGSYLWSFSAYCGAENEIRKGRRPEEEDVAMASTKGKPKNELNNNDQRHVDASDYQRQHAVTRFHQSRSSDIVDAMAPREHQVVSKLMSYRGHYAPTRGRYDGLNS